MTAPAVVTLHVWGVAPRRVPAALLRLATQRRPLRRAPGARFAKLLGTGSGRTFTRRDADLGHWAMLVCWESAAAAAAFEAGPLVGAWDRAAHERLRVLMGPLAARGRWSGRTPFGTDRLQAPAGPVAVITRARIRPRRSRAFWRAVPPVAAGLRDAPGLRLAFGIGEAPIGLQGTFSLWQSSDSLVGFAYRQAAHAAAIRRTSEVGWYAESLFARFTVLDVAGRYQGRRP